MFSSILIFLFPSVLLSFVLFFLISSVLFFLFSSILFLLSCYIYSFCSSGSILFCAPLPCSLPRHGFRCLRHSPVPGPAPRDVTPEAEKAANIAFAPEKDCGRDVFVL